MYNLRLPLILILLCFSALGFSQIKFSIKQLPNSEEWGVFARACQTISPSGNTITGSAQVTVVLPLGSDIEAFTNHAGLWEENATVSGPTEAPGKNFISFGFLSDSPQIVYNTEEETLLFSFTISENQNVLPKLIDNENDLFAKFPNSTNSNPGNEISVIDIGIAPVGYYSYTGNFSFEGLDDCFEVVDTTIVTPPDTSGNGENPTATLEPIKHKNCFTLAPNPTSNWLSVQFLALYFNSNGTIRLWTTNGVAIGELAKNGQSKVTLNVAALPSGIYFLSYESEGKLLQQERFIKQ